MNCYLCQIEIEDTNCSIEHILPNCLGGKLKSKLLLCKSCNHDTSVYEKELNKLASFFIVKNNIKRDRDGYHSPISAIDEETGRAALFHSNGIATLTDSKVDIIDGELIITSYNKKRALNELSKVVKDLASKGIKVDTSEMKVERQRNSEDIRTLYYTPQVDHYFMMKAILKIFINYFIHKGGNPNSVRKAIEYLKNINELDHRYCNYYDKNLSKDFCANKPCHILILKNEKKEVKGYFEMFGKIGFIVVISTDYLGEDFQWNYTYDPVTHTELQISYSFDEKVFDIFTYFLQKRDIDPNCLESLIQI